MAGEIKGDLAWPEFCSAVRRNFPHLSLIVKHYLNGKLFDIQLLPNQIIMNHESSILEQEYLSLLLLSNNKILSNEFDLLYSSLKDGTSFNRLSHAIRGIFTFDFITSGYDGPTFIIFEHVDNGDSSSEIKKGDKFLFGVYSFETWNDHLSYTGDSQEFLFALTPKFRALQAKKGTSKGQNYRYLYSKKSQIHKHKIGLGNSLSLFKGKELEVTRILKISDCGLEMILKKIVIPFLRTSHSRQDIW
jgi:TLD